jgi:hypothetical protein
VVLYGWPEMLTLGDVLPQALGLVALLVITIVAFVRVPPLGFLGAWFFVALAPASSVLPIATEVGAERRMYVPLMALATLAVLAVWFVVRARVARVALLIVAVAGLGTLTMRRTAEYASGVRLARTVVERRPTAVAHHLLGEQLAIAGQTAEAETELRAAVQMGDSRARYQLAVVLVNAQRLPEAAAQLEAFVATTGVPQRLRWLEPPLPRRAHGAPATGADLHHRAAVGRRRGAGRAWCSRSCRGIPRRRASSAPRSSPRRSGPRLLRCCRTI